MPETHVEPMDLTAIGEEYERMHNAAKVLYRRKAEMDNLMRIHLIGHDSIETKQHIYRMSSTTETEFLDPYQVADVFRKAYGQTIPKVVRRLMKVSKTEFDVLVKALDGKLPLLERKAVKEELAKLIETHPNPKLQAYKNPTSEDKKPVKNPRPKPKRRLRV